jgi:GxxExxY protein
MVVHGQLGLGFLEPVYQAALEREFQLQKIPFSREVEIPVSYKGKPLNVSYRADFICFANVIVELKEGKGCLAKRPSRGRGRRQSPI